jgi:peptide deformylase
MAKLKIITYPNKALREKAKKITSPESSDIKKTIDEMIACMKEHNGLGLAATQIGKPIRLCVIEEEGEKYVMINPKITSFSKELIEIEEGCLSFPGKYFLIKRPEKIKARYLNENGERVKIKADGLLARAVQHEIDHLDGILLIDHKKQKK